MVKNQNHKINQKMKTTILVSIFFLLAVSVSAQSNSAGIRSSSLYGVPTKSDINLEKVKVDLLERQFQYWTNGTVKVRKTWVFAALSEFRRVTILNQTIRPGYLEKDLYVLMSDLKTGELYEGRILVVYRKYETPDWVFDKFDVIRFYKVK